MKNFKLVFLFLFLSHFVKSQDSLKAVNQELGFNTVLLIKQLFSNNPTSTLPQLPYAVFYNHYFNEKIGIRVGLGLSTSKTKTTIDNQSSPRETSQISANLRIGVSTNFLTYKRIAFNAFVDALHENTSFKTVNTQTIQTGPTNTLTIKTTSVDKLSGFGAQIGVGVKYNLYKHLSLYAEVPLSFLSETENSTVNTTTTNQPMQDSRTKNVNLTSRITLPTTLYLVLRF